MKNFLSKIALSSLILITITSCSVESLEDQGLSITEENDSISNVTTKSLDSTMYIMWNDEVTESDKNSLRDELMYSNNVFQLESFFILESPNNSEQWVYSFNATESDTKDPRAWVKKKSNGDIGIASVDPF